MDIKKIKVREEVEKLRNTLCFLCFSIVLGPEGQKVGSLKRRVRSYLARREIKNCTRLWREADFDVVVEKVHWAAGRSGLRSQSGKKHHVRTTFGRSTVIFRDRRNRLCTFTKTSQT